MNTILRIIVRLYPFKKGKYRLMKLCQSLLSVGSTYTTAHGKTMLVDITKKDGLQSSFFYFWPSEYESWTQRYIRENVHAGMKVVDCGAHVGFMTLLLADRVTQSGTVLAIEPDEYNFNMLQRNVRINFMDQVMFANCAVSNRNGSANLYKAKSDAGHSLLCRVGNEHTTVTVKPLDFLIASADLIKIDVEGVEEDVLLSAESLLMNHKIGAVICEVRPKLASWDRMRLMMHDCGYGCYALSVLSGKKYGDEIRVDDYIRGTQNVVWRLR